MLHGEHITVAFEAIGSQGPNRAVLGVTADGDQFIVDRTCRPHCMVTGESGGGKGIAVRLMKAHDIATENLVAVIQPKAGEDGWLEGVAPVGTTFDEWYEILARATGIMQDRLRVTETHRDPHTGLLGIDTLADLPNPPPLVSLYIDELDKVIGPEALLNAPTYDEVKEYERRVREMTMMIGNIAKRGRSVLIRLVLIAQDPHIGANFHVAAMGGPILKTIGQRLHFDGDPVNLSEALRKAQRPADDIVEFVRADNKPGRCAYVHCDAVDGSQVKAAQTMFITPLQARRVVETHLANPLLDHGEHPLAPVGLPDTVDLDDEWGDEQIPDDYPDTEADADVEVVWKAG